MRTLKELAQEAINIQDACNINIVHGMSEALTELRQIMPTASTQTLNRHPIMKMWAAKIQALCTQECLCNDCTVQYKLAYEWCREQVNGVIGMQILETPQSPKWQEQRLYHARLNLANRPNSKPLNAWAIQAFTWEEAERTARVDARSMLTFYDLEKTKVMLTLDGKEIPL